MDSQKYQKLEWVSTQFYFAESFTDLINIWKRNELLLQGCRLIISRENDEGFQIKRTVEHSMLKSLFASDKFFYIDDSVVRNHITGVVEGIPVDSLIILDTNLVAKIKGFINKRADRRIKGLVESIIDKPFYYGCYALENYEKYIVGENHYQIKEKIRSVLFFDNLNKELYLESRGERIESEISEQELEERTNEKINKIFSLESLPALIALKNAIYALLLKTCEIQFRSIREGIFRKDEKINEIYEFMHFELVRFFGKEARLVSMFLDGDSRLEDCANENLSFFDPIQISNKRILHSLNGMAMDLTILREIERMPDASNLTKVLIPYFLSDDCRLNYVCDSLLPRLSAARFYSEEKGATFIPIWENQIQNQQELTAKHYYNKISWFYDDVAHRIRIKEQHENSKIAKLEFDSLVKQLENEVESFVLA